jgi:hypothetical protein
LAAWLLVRFFVRAVLYGRRGDGGKFDARIARLLTALVGSRQFSGWT